MGMNFIESNEYVLFKLCAFSTLGAPWCVKSVSKRSKILLFIFVDNFKPSSMVKTNLKNFESLRSYMSISTPYIDISWWIKNDIENTFKTMRYDRS